MMQHVNLLGAHATYLDLRSFSRFFFGILGVENEEGRESENYIGGYYTKGSLGRLIFTVASSEDAAHEGWSYWIHVSADMPEPEVLEEVVAQLLRDKMPLLGFGLARITNLGKRNEQRIEY
ncbi:hypothetical protein [Ralstonia solanacearum]|uniref:hypothetical protein n=1 Tax=Ralstonia solanacearum TaxID=305 RepID=UPI001E41117E|nr:hypothetical protein [Ralstonia solanacearum]